VSRCALIVAVCIATARLAGAAVPAVADVAGARGMAPFSFFEDEIARLDQAAFLTGDWGGLRPKLLDRGITPSLAFVTDVQGNPVGGRHRAVRESDDLGLNLSADLGRLAGWAGARLQLSFSMRSGTSLSDTDIGNVFTVAEVCCGHTYRLVNVELQQSLFDDRVSLRGGRIAAGDEFLTSSGALGGGRARHRGLRVAWKLHHLAARCGTSDRDLAGGGRVQISRTRAAPASLGEGSPRSAIRELRKLARGEDGDCSE
jgi:hypothetical protein